MTWGVWGVGLPPQNAPLGAHGGHLAKGNHIFFGMGPYYMI